VATAKQLSDLVGFIESSGLKLIKRNERQWGSFEIAMSWDQQQWFADGQVFGSMYSTHEAACWTLAKYILSPPMNAQFAVWAGKEHLTRLFSIIKYPEDEVKNIITVE
jgi:hypothetical protein